jgi:SAM-dependent methyltransferase
VLDLGFGSGWDLDYFADLGYDIAGLDISRRQVARVRERHSDSRILLGDISRADEYFVLGSFDGVWASSAVAHMDRIEAEKTFRAMHYALAAGGTGYVSVTCRVDVNAPETIEKKTPSGNTVMRYDWLPDDLFESLERAGFTVTDAEYSGMDSPDAFVYVFLHKA